MIQDANVSTDLITYVEDCKDMTEDMPLLLTKIRKEVGWEPETMFKDGIKKTIAWFF